MDENRITMITLFDNESLEKISYCIKDFEENFCKVPFRITNRKINDTLPYHFTLSFWNENEIEIAKKVFENVKFDKISLKILGVDIKESYNNSWNLYFYFKVTNELYNLQKKIYNMSKLEKFNPDIYMPHITIHCDKDYNKLLKLKYEIMKNFVPFNVYFDKLGLFKIYPAIKI